MSDDDELTAAKLLRVPTGLHGLDTILHGGLFRGGVYVVHARPGSGKTILGNQVCFGHVAAGGRALFVTLLTESHSRMLAQLENMSFFDPPAVGATLSYVSGYQTLEKEGLAGLLVLLRRLVRDCKATCLVIDGVVTAGAMSESELEIKKFIHELQVYAELVGCTTLLLTGESQTGQQYAFRTMVDGLIELHLDAAGMEASRSLEVTKFRGSTVLMGRHLFEITSAGLTIYPRTEAAFGRSPDRPDPRDTRPAAFGMEGLDMALGGGLRAGSTTMVLGMPGSGKTLLGLSWLAAGAAAQEQGLYFGFFETPSDLLRKAEGIGLPWGDAIASGRIEVVWEPPLGVIADRLAEKLLAAVSRRHVRRLFIDGLAGLSDALINTRRSRRFFSALCNELRSRGVATILSDETRSLREFEVDTSDEGLTAMLDNVISLRHVEIASRRSKLAAVLKTREKAGDETVHGYSIGPRGFTVSTARPDDRYVEELQREEKASPVAKKRSKRRRR